MTVNFQQAVCTALKLEPSQIKEYPSSYIRHEEDQLILLKIEGVKKILASGNGTFCSKLNGELLSNGIKLCPLTHQNRLVLNEFLPYTLPSAFGRQIATVGVGDRLGIATPGHIRSFKNSHAKPVLAQQSKRELDLTGRNYEKVLDDVCYAVFQEGYQGGFGADGDHLKTIADIQDALKCGYTMITLDCSEKIGRGIEKLTSAEAEAAYKSLPASYRNRIESDYLSKGFLIGNETLSFSKEDLISCTLIYRDAVEFVREVYFDCIQQAGNPVDFELSIDETESVTTAHGHLFVAMELEYLEVEVTSLAPRFIGEFQKGIDYLGEITEFERQLQQHAAIADQFGYKLSIHSGSDKFSVFLLIGKHTRGRLHLKTSGTNWLEAVGTIAEKNPLLYRKIHRRALETFELAKKFYHVSGDPEKVKPLELCDDSELSDYLKDDNSRQLLHITYGFILEDVILKEELYHTLEADEEHYYGRLVSHIGRHLELVNPHCSQIKS